MSMYQEIDRSWNCLSWFEDMTQLRSSTIFQVTQDQFKPRLMSNQPESCIPIQDQNNL